MAAASSGLRSRVTEVVTCPICLDDFKDPRSLPCVHSFCLQCLQGHCKDKCPRTYAKCPLCRKEFQIPQNGLQTLPHNFFLQNLVDAKKTKNGTGTASCEPCLEEGRTKSATVYCVDCSQKLCNRCSTPHKKWKGKPHDVRPTGDELSAELIWLRGSYCDKHPDRRLELYCFDCRGNVCMECCLMSHNHHKYEKIEKVAKDFVASIQSGIKPFPSRISQFREAIKKVELASQKFSENVKKMELQVQRKGDEMKRLIDDHVDRLMKELDEAKTSSVKVTKTHVERFELAVTGLESFHTYASYLTSKGSACDVTRAGNDLHVRADELLKTYVTDSEYCPPDVQFVPTNTDDISVRKNIIGSITSWTVESTVSPMAARPTPTPALEEGRQTTTVSPIQQYSQPNPQVIHTFPTAENVCGVTLLNNELYVLRQRTSDQVDVYSTTDFTRLRQLNVPGLSARGMRDITACVQKQCVCISDGGNSCIHRVGVDKSVSKWPVNGTPWGLSVTRSGNVLVTCRVSGANDKLVELSSEDGKLVQETPLEPDIKDLWHSIQLANNQYVVCHGEDGYDSGVSLVGSDGRVIQLRSKDAGLNRPYHTAIDDDAFIFVADKDNQRIVLFDPSLNYVRDVIQHMEHGPRRLCYDDVTRRLYVGQLGGNMSIIQQ